MPLKNYTTKIKASRTVGEIQELLAGAGAKSVLLNYEEGVPVAVSFLIGTAFGDRGFNLPANAAGVFAVMTRDANKRQMDRAYASYDQAVRVAWRTIQDWIEAQLAIIQAGVVTLDQVMLPWMVDQNNQTVYEEMTKRQLMLPAGK